MMTGEEMSELVEPHPPPVEDGASESWVPRIDMVFENDEKAYQFYCYYAKEMGFAVRKHLVKRRASGLVYSRVFTCYKEGCCRTKKDEREVKKPRANSRTGCLAHMTIRIMKDGRYRINEFVPTHNHELVTEAEADVMDSTDDSVMAGKAKIKLMGRPTLKSYIPPKSKNGMMRFSQERQGDNPSVECVELHPPMGDDGNRNWVPELDMEFEDDEEAYQFYVNYASGTGFSVRKHLIKRRASGIIYSRTYVCHKEGYRRKKDEQQARDPKPYDRTGCLASMTIKITKNGRYRVSEFQPRHNHALVIPTKAHLFKWRWGRGLIKSQADLMDLAVDSGMSPEASYEDMGGQAGSRRNPSFLSADCKNYLPLKRKYSLKVGDVGAVMQYVQAKQAEYPSFYYALQLDEDDQVTNFFWADTKSMADFNYFGDVVCFDTTYKTNDYSRSFAPFTGVNHHKQAIVFGAALVYDETEDSFKWLFETFKTAMCGKQPKVILTDQCLAMSNAIAAVWPGTIHRLCVWHMYHNAAKHLAIVFQGSTTFARDFGRCVYDYEEEEEFLSEWKVMLEKYDLGKNEWLIKLYEDREKWALAYGRQTFCADMKSTQIRECLNSMLKEYLSSDRDLLEFFKHFDSTLDECRHAELQADFCVSVPKIPTSRMLRQAANLYTPAVFKVFEKEFELSMDCMVYSCGQVGATFEYKVSVEENPKEYIVRFDSSDGTIVCSCKKFEFVGIQCRHVLKALDIVNIKELLPQYILKRWRKDAKVRSATDNCEYTVDGDTKPSLAKRYSSLCCIFNKIAVRAAETLESYTFIESLSDQLMDQVYQILQTRPPERPQFS